MTDPTAETLAARVSFFTQVDGVPRRIAKDTLYASDHPIVRANPTRFKPVNVREKPGAHAAAALQRQAARPKVVATPPPPTRDERVAELVAAKREELNTLATAAGIEDADDLTKFSTKRDLAEAIVDGVAPPDDDESAGSTDDGTSGADDDGSGAVGGTEGSDPA